MPMMVMRGCVRGPRHDAQIVSAVVCLIFVNVVNDFVLP
jgi:hypothetical protein